MPRVFKMVERKCLNCKYSRIYRDDNYHNKLVCTLDDFEAVEVKDNHKCTCHKFMSGLDALEDNNE